MNIVLAAQEYPPGTGGIATQTRAKAEGLTELGHDVTVVTCSRDGQRHDREEDRVRVIRIPGSHPALPVNNEITRLVTYSTALATELAELRTTQEIDLVDAPDYGGEAFVHLLDREPWATVPTVLQLHGGLAMLARTIGWPEAGSRLHEVGRFMERTSLALADAVYSSSHCSLRWAQEEYALPLLDVPVIHAGVDTARFRPPPHPFSGPPSIVSVGRVTRSKGAVELLTAAERLAAKVPGLRMLLAGRVDEELRVLVEAVQRRHPGLVETLGPVPHDQLPRLLADASVFALPSHFEGGPGLSYLEAMACGLPVVASSAGGASEVVLDGETGFLVPPGRPEAVEAALLPLLEDHALRRRIGSAARAYVESEADRKACMRRLDAFYRHVVERARG